MKSSLQQIQSKSRNVPAPRPPLIHLSSPLLPRAEHVKAPLTKDLWIAENNALVRESREADRELLRLVSAHATAVGSSAAALSSVFADVYGLIEASKLEVRDDRNTILSNVRDLRDSVTALSSRIKEAAAADAATTEYHDPSLRIARVKQVTNAAEFVSSSFKAFREKQKKAYIRLSEAESQLSVEINEFEKALAKEEAETAAEIDARNAQEREKEEVKVVKADLAAESAARGAAELAAAVSDTAALLSKANIPNASLSPLHSAAIEDENIINEHSNEKKGNISSGVTPTVPVLRARIAAIDDEVEKLGGLTGGWREDDHATFKASLSVFLSQRGRPHVLSVRHSAAYFEEIESKGENVGVSENFRLVLPAPLMDESESHTFIARLSSLLPYVGNDKLRNHLKWFSWFRERQAEKLGITDLWRKISKKPDSHKPTFASDSPPKNESSSEQQIHPKGSTPEIRIAVATWRARREEEKRRANAEQIAKAREMEAQRMLSEKEKREHLTERINEWHAGGGGAREVEIAVHLPPPPKPVDARLLKQRASAALAEAARARKELDAAKKAVELATMKRLGDPSRSGFAGSASAVKFLSPSSSGGEKGADVFAFWSSLPADPARPTTASHARETTQTDLEERTAQKKTKSAHEQIVASTAVKSKGRDFSFGGRSSLPSLKTPSWRKGV